MQPPDALTRWMTRASSSPTRESALLRALAARGVASLACPACPSTDAMADNSTSSSSSHVTAGSASSSKRRRAADEAAADTATVRGDPSMEAEDGAAEAAGEADDVPRAKKPSRAASNTVGSSIILADPGCSLEAELRAAELVAARVAHSLRVLGVIDQCRREFISPHIYSLCNLLLQGTSDECAMLDASSMLKANEADAAEPLLAHLVHLLLRYQPTRAQGPDIPPEFRESWGVFRSALDRIVPQLMLSVEPIAVHAETGDTLLHLVARSDRVLVPWMKQLCAQFMERGFDPNARNFAGNTPILLAAEKASVSGILLLRSLGADCNTQRNSDGASVLHVLVTRRASDALLELFSRANHGMDLFMLNHAGQTAAEMASRALADSAADQRHQAWKVAQTLQQQTELFRKNVSPLIRRMLSAHLIPVLVSIAMGYIDGSGPAPPTAGSAAAASAAAAESKENDEE